MREYGQIQCSFWQRACEEEWSNDAMLLGAYLLTGPHSNGVGCYRLPTGYVCDDLNWDAERVEKGFTELFDKGFANRFGRVVLIPKFLRWNSISNGNVAKARQQEFEAIPNDEAKCHAARALIDFGNHWEEGFIKRLETLSKGLPKQNPTQPNPNQPKRESGSPDGDPPAPQSKSKPKTGHRIPDSFPTNDELTWATENFPRIDHNTEAAKFRDYWVAVPGAKGRKVDWPATWRNWIRRSAENQKPSDEPARSPSQRRLN